VALTTLGFERSAATASGGRVGGSVHQVLALAQHLGRGADPVTRQRLADLYIRFRILGLNAARTSAALRAGRTPGPEMSFGKLAWANAASPPNPAQDARSPSESSSANPGGPLVETHRKPRRFHDFCRNLATTA
jgi:hypothetical protein